MLEYIKSLIMGFVAGITAPLPVSSSGHFSFAEKLLGYTADREESAFYYSVFMVAFSVVMLINIRELYSKLFSGFSKNRKNHRLRFVNLLASVAVGVVLFVPLPVIGRSLNDCFDLFFDCDNIFNSILIGFTSVFTGFILAVSVWYIKKGRSAKKKTVPVRSALRMNIYSIPAYVIPGTSKVALSSVNLSLCDVNRDVIYREVYFYLAPQVLAVNLIRATLLFLDGVRPEITSLAVGVVAVLIAAFLVTAIIRKADSGKVLLLFSIYSVLFGAVVIAYTLFPIFSGV